MDPLPDEMTIKESYEPCSKIMTKAEADEYFERLVERGMRISGKSREETEQIQRHNIGYYSGYFDPVTMARMQELFCCAHPVFGRVTTEGIPSPEQAVEAGKKLAKGAR